MRDHKCQRKISKEEDLRSRSSSFGPLYPPLIMDRIHTLESSVQMRPSNLVLGQSCRPHAFNPPGTVPDMLPSSLQTIYSPAAAAVQSNIPANYPAPAPPPGYFPPPSVQHHDSQNSMNPQYHQPGAPPFVVLPPPYYDHLYRDDTEDEVRNSFEGTNQHQPSQFGLGPRGSVQYVRYVIPMYANGPQNAEYIIHSVPPANDGGELLFYYISPEELQHRRRHNFATLGVRILFGVFIFFIIFWVIVPRVNNWQHNHKQK